MTEEVFCPFCTRPLKNADASLIRHVWIHHRPAMVMLRALPADRPKYEWEIERDTLLEQIAQLESELYGRHWKPPIELGLRGQEEQFLACLVAESGYRTRATLFDAINHGNATVESKLVEVVAHRLRRRIAPFGLRIETVHSRGYRLPDKSRERLLNWPVKVAA